MNKGLVSVILPVYNETKYLKEAINSILNQTYPFIELIIINDGSNDEGKTESIILKYGDRVKYVKKENGGVASAINLGIKIANGEYIARMDADDISLPNRIELQVKYMNQHMDVGVCGTQFLKINKDGKVISESNFPTENDEIKVNFLFRNVICHPTVMFRKKVIDDGWEYGEDIIAEDYDLWTRMIPTVKFMNIPDVTYRYRISGNNITELKKNQICNAASKIARSYIERLFKISLKEIEEKHFYINSSRREYGEQLFINIKKQFEIFYYIELKNDELKIVNPKILQDLLNYRWHLFFDSVGSDEILLKNCETILMVKKDSNEESIVKKIDKKYKCNMVKEKIFEALDTELDNFKYYIYRMSQTDKSFAIYGGGIRGKRLLERYISLKTTGKIKWKMTGVFDKNISKIECQQEIYQVLKPDRLMHDTDYIVISSNIYFDEIRTELLTKGICSEKILKGLWLDFL